MTKVINVDHRSDSDLGRRLSAMNFQPWTHPVHRNFNSMEGFWWWIKSKGTDDHFRFMHPVQCRLRGSPLYRNQEIDDFHVIIMEANYFRVANDPDLQAAIIESTEPFDLFYTDNQGRMVRPAPYKWIIPGWEYIRTCLRDNVAWDSNVFRSMLTK